MYGMSTLTTMPAATARTTAQATWLVSSEGDELAFETSRAAAEHLVDLQSHWLPGAPLPFTIQYGGEDPVDYTGYVADVFRATGWQALTPAQRRCDGRRRELVIELTTAILVGG